MDYFFKNNKNFVILDQLNILLGFFKYKLKVLLNKKDLFVIVLKFWQNLNLFKISYNPQLKRNDHFQKRSLENLVKFFKICFYKNNTILLKSLR